MTTADAASQIRHTLLVVAGRDAPAVARVAVATIGIEAAIRFDEMHVLSTDLEVSFDVFGLLRTGHGQGRRAQQGRFRPSAATSTFSARRAARQSRRSRPSAMYGPLRTRSASGSRVTGRVDRP